MNNTVYLHVGPHKTGTTYVQGLLMRNCDRLAEQGVLYPRKTFRNQGRAVREALGRGKMPATGADVTGAWPKLAAELSAWDGRAVLSHEMMASASAAEIKRMLKALGDSTVHVIYTARDLTRVAPAMWQTGLRSRQPFSWEYYAQSLRHPDSDHGPWGKRFWSSQYAPDALARWRKHLPADRLHVITVPRAGSAPELLWQRFCSVLGVDPSGHDLQPPRSNPSLGTAEAELLRRVNEQLAATDVDNSRSLFWIRWLGRQLENRPDMSKFTLPVEDFEWMAERSRGVVEGLRDGGYHVVGDLSDLLPQPVDPARAKHPSDTDDHAVLDVAVDALHRTVRELTLHKRAARPGDAEPDDY
ncbi:MAG: hypothetical protein M3529_10140 [Actinomycetota bacterium]|nr:hypothetical protein [Actinomycetota bacterium]